MDPPSPALVGLDNTYCSFPVGNLAQLVSDLIEEVLALLTVASPTTPNLQLQFSSR